MLLGKDKGGYFAKGEVGGLEGAFSLTCYVTHRHVAQVTTHMPVNNIHTLSLHKFQPYNHQSLPLFEKLTLEKTESACVHARAPAYTTFSA